MLPPARIGGGGPSFGRGSGCPCGHLSAAGEIRRLRCRRAIAFRPRPSLRRWPLPPRRPRTRPACGPSGAGRGRWVPGPACAVCGLAAGVLALACLRPSLGPLAPLAGSPPGHLSRLAPPAPGGCGGRLLRPPFWWRSAPRRARVKAPGLRARSGIRIGLRIPVRIPPTLRLGSRILGKSILKR